MSDPPTSEPKKTRTARSLRQRETDLERKLWQQLRNRRFAHLKLRRQHPIGPYVADFACPAAKLVIEIDGPWHAKRVAKDNFRTDQLRRFGYEVVRFDIADGSLIDPLAESIIHAAKERLAFLSR